MAFKNLNEVFDGRLALPGPNGKVYRVPEPDAELGLWCTAMYTAGLASQLGQQMPDGSSLPPLQLDDDAEDAMYRRVLGPVHAELLADGYGLPTVRFFAQTAFFWIAAGPEIAEAFWNAGGQPDPKAQAPNRAARRAAKTAPPATASTSSTAAARTTRKAASMSGTTPRKAPSRKPSARP